MHADLLHQHLLKPLLETSDMRDGLEHLVQRFEFYMALTPLLLSDSWTDQQDFKKFSLVVRNRVINLYTKLLLYQMRASRACYARWVTAVKDYVKVTSWRERLSELMAVEHELERNIEKYNTEVKKDSLRTAVKYQKLLLLELSASREHKQTVGNDNLIGQFACPCYDANDISSLHKKRIPGLMHGFRPTLNMSTGSKATPSL